MKSRNPSLLSNSAASPGLGRRAAALPNRPNRMMEAPVSAGSRVRAKRAMFKMPVSYRRHSATAWGLRAPTGPLARAAALAGIGRRFGGDPRAVLVLAWRVALVRVEMAFLGRFAGSAGGMLLVFPGAGHWLAVPGADLS